MRSSDVRPTSARLPLLLAALATAFMMVLSGALAQADDTLSVRARSGADIETMDPAFYSGNEEFNLDQIIFSKLVKFQPGSPEVQLDAA